MSDVSLPAARIALDRHDRRLARHDAFALHVDEGVGSSQVDREIVREQAVEPVENHPWCVRFKMGRS